MSLVKITQIPGVAIGLDGNELMELVQGGASKQARVGLIAALANTGTGGTAEFLLISASSAFPNSRGLSVETDVLELTDEGAQGNLIVSVADGGIANAKLADMADRTLKGNISGATATPVDLSLAQVQGGVYAPTVISDVGIYHVPVTALSLIISKTDGADVVLPALALKVGPVRIVAPQADSFPFNVIPADGTIMGLATFAFSGPYQSATFYPSTDLSAWTT